MWTLRHWYLPRKPDNPVPDSVIDNLADIRRLVTLFPYTLPLMEALSVSASSDMGVSTEFDGGSGLFPGRHRALYSPNRRCEWPIMQGGRNEPLGYRHSCYPCQNAWDEGRPYPGLALAPFSSPAHFPSGRCWFTRAAHLTDPTFTCRLTIGYAGTASLVLGGEGIRPTPMSHPRHGPPGGKGEPPCRSVESRVSVMADPRHIRTFNPLSRPPKVLLL